MPYIHFLTDVTVGWIASALSELLWWIVHFIL